MSIYVAELRTCKICKEWKSEEEFIYHNRNKNVMCHSCKLKQKKDYQARRKELFAMGILRHPPAAKCNDCNEYLPKHYFDFNVSKLTGLNSYCKYHRTMRSVINKAKRKSTEGIMMVMTREEFFGKLDGTCYYCGTRDNIGVDRIDSLVGYSKENCISCCSTCNWMKNNSSVYDFIKQCKKIAAYQKVSFI